MSVIPTCINSVPVSYCYLTPQAKPTNDLKLHNGDACLTDEPLVPSRTEVSCQWLELHCSDYVEKQKEEKTNSLFHKDFKGACKKYVIPNNCDL